MTPNTRCHDIVVVGASAGGVEALTRVVAGLPKSLAAAVFVVLHIPPDVPSALAAILNRAGPLPAVQAHDRLPIEPGCIYVAPPNRHMVLHQSHVGLQAGPRENSARPSVDVLFRSAAQGFGRRVVGVVLSGTLRDGALGLAAIKLRGGVTIVQDPDEALFAGMPENALSTSPVDFRLRAGDIPARLVELSKYSVELVPMTTSEPEPMDRSIHAADEPGVLRSPKPPNFASGLTCPECEGSLWELEDGETERAETTERHAAALLGLLRRMIAEGEVG